MYCQNRIVYTVQEGDSLYRLARQYRTTVTELILGNPGVNPYNLQIGMQLYICPGEDYDGAEQGMPDNRPNMPQMPQMPETPGSRPNMPQMPQMPQMPETPSNRPNMPEMNEETENEKENAVENLVQEMRLAWLDLIYWTRMYLMSVDAGTGDRQEIEERVLQAADEITDVFAEFLPIAATRQLRNLLTEHVELTNELIRMGKEGGMEDYDALVKEWYANINRIADLFGQLNPYFSGRETRNLLLNYLDLTRTAIEQQLNGEYGQSIETFRALRKHVLDMADFFARGLLAR